jgi:polysaccharide biosynthesis/export protein
MKKNCILCICGALILAAGQSISAAQVGTQNPSALVDTKAIATDSTATNATPASAASTSAPASAPSSGAPQFGTRDPRYRLAPSDSFDLTFPLSPEYNQLAVTVQPDGFVALYGVGEAKVQGETVPELTETIRTAYGKVLHDPIISVVLKDFNKPYFIANGKVGHPGKYDLRADTTLTEAIAIAGGFTDDAKHSQVVLFRRSGDQWVASQVFNVKDMEAKKNLREDPTLHPGDMLYVPQNRISKIKGFFPNYGVGGVVPIN